ncbi:unnamed protein product [Euphydryas editha]|uniref:CCHC-type domain-containing protein n=1 Tax=Euphydryas editha TaxID=104508 RepID=A0AAU9UTP7_EUPED|nr:unnamed protein product [Euphydryas editha]
MAIIKGISNHIVAEDLTSIILGQNPELGEFDNTHLQLKFKRNNRNPSLYNAVFVTSPNAFRILTAMGRVRIEYQRVHVGEHSPFLQCHSCLQFGHTQKRCTNPLKRCAHCANEGHTHTDCPTKEQPATCHNCTAHNTRFTTNKQHPTNHKATSITPHSIALVSEPYIGNRREAKLNYGTGLQLLQFPGDSLPTRACIIAKQHVRLLGLPEFSSPDLCVVRAQIGHSQLLIASIYIEPKINAHSGNDTLARAEHLLQHHMHTQCVLGGDFNGWNTLWGSAYTNARGREVEELAHAGGLYVCNTGSTPTFECVTHGRMRSSIIDLTLASYPTCDSITDWKVNLDACPSSQHNAVDYTITHNHPHSHTHTEQHTNTSTFRYKSHRAHWPSFESSSNAHLLHTHTRHPDRHAQS